MKRRSESQARSDLRARLQERRGEIEEAALARIRAIADPSEAVDPAYAAGLRRALGAAIEFGLSTLDSGGAAEPPVPLELLAQARLAARNGIGLGIVLRRYLAGYSLLSFFLIEEASRDRLLSGAELQRVIVVQGGRFDRLLAAIGEEHARESETLALATGERRRAERVRRLLDGEPVDGVELAYDIDNFHSALIAEGPGAAQAIRRLSAELDRTLLFVQPGASAVWAWLGGRNAISSGEVFARAVVDWPTGATLAIGETGEGLKGWRFSHRQARAALPLAERESPSIVRYADIAVLASALRDDLLAATLAGLYLAPLSAAGESDSVLSDTLRAYFACGQKVSSTAAMLGVSRQTVSSRLRMAEERIGRPLTDCAAELQIALRLQQLSDRQAR